jgi:hypothetical protein
MMIELFQVDFASSFLYGTLTIIKSDVFLLFTKSSSVKGVHLRGVLPCFVYKKLSLLIKIIT